VVKAYDPPEVFAVFTGEDQTKPFGDDFCCIDDQNGDGCDELLVNNDPIILAYGNYDAVNQVMFYWGGEDMDNNPDIIFRTNVDRLGIGMSVPFNGNVIPDHNQFFTLETTLEVGGYFGNLYMYEAGEEIDNEVDLILTTPEYDGYSGLYPCTGRRNRPTDLNGDGFNDIIVKEVNENGNDRPLTIFFGGADFDTIPDWRLSNYPWGSILDIVSGFDINGDGYDDVIVEAEAYSVFFGGDPMDTTVAFYFGSGDFECDLGPVNIGHELTVFGDVNNDGYDDWGVDFLDQGGPEGPDFSGFFVFFGGEEPDLEPDLILDGIHHGWITSDEESIAGGDFNGDGIGDIVTGCSDNNIDDYGEVCFYFGSRWIEGGAPDLMVRNRDQAFRNFPNLGCKVGAAGDYNGDGVDDIVVKSSISGNINQLVILLGNEDWVVGVEESDLPKVYELSLEANPNPFNNQVTISYQMPISGNVQLSVYDVQGRLVEQLVNSHTIAGDYKTTWQSQTSGIYLVMLQAETASVVKKVVCIK
jgi:hypothetical protein